MRTIPLIKRRLPINKPGVILLTLAMLLLCCAAGCSRAKPSSPVVQGYVEGEFVYVSAPLSGKLKLLAVKRGAEVNAGDLLFELENVTEKAVRDETEKRLAQIRSQVADAKKGKRPTEIEATEAELNQARTALQLSEKELLRQETLLTSGVVSAQEADQIRSRRDQDRQRVAQLEAELHTAKLGARSDQIAAAEASMQAMQAALGRSEWDLSQKAQKAPVTGLVVDTLFIPGEWVAAGRPAVVLLPPQNIKVRTFVPQPILSSIHPGDTLQVTVDGATKAFSGQISYISPRAEYTPPVIYSQESRDKLVYMIELSFDPAAAQELHPGQPVTVRLSPVR